MAKTTPRRNQALVLEASARPVSTSERRRRPSPKRHNLFGLWSWQDATPKSFLPTVYPALPCVVWRAPHVTRADIGSASPSVVWRAPHVTRADIGSL